MNKKVLAIAGLAVLALLVLGCTQPQNPASQTNAGASDNGNGANTAVPAADNGAVVAVDANVADAGVAALDADNNALADTSSIDSIDLPDFSGIQ